MTDQWFSWPLWGHTSDMDITTHNSTKLKLWSGNKPMLWLGSPQQRNWIKGCSARRRGDHCSRSSHPWIPYGHLILSSLTSTAFHLDRLQFCMCFLHRDFLSEETSDSTASDKAFVVPAPSLLPMPLSHDCNAEFLVFSRIFFLFSTETTAHNTFSIHPTQIYTCRRVPCSLFIWDDT